ncbi:MAG: Na+/H+ antiporter NhaC family protein [Lachnospiraceae bacterium]|nr:Na+/H+ antiporter NhaC family protein [Lachnospiraceae bacterium]
MKKLTKRGFRAVAFMCVIAFCIGLLTASMKPVSVKASEAAEAAAETAFSVDYDGDVVDYDLTDPDSAQEYVGSYADNLGADPDFRSHVSTAIDKVREDVKPYATWMSLLAPIVAIVLALITKEVYSSLVIGILVGGILYAGGNPEGVLNHVLFDGFVANIADSYNMGILIFLVLLGAMVALMNKAGGSAAFGRWATTHIKTRVGAQLATIALGVLIFIDDYFNCLTVGSVMRPVTDGHNISRAKLSYLIDATAAPVCIIAPISSWAAAVAGFANAAGAENGIALFVQAIPYNFYAILTIVMMLFLAITGVDYGPMRLHEQNAKNNNDLFTSGVRPALTEMDVNEKGKVADLIFPIAVLIIACVIGMIYSGGFFEGEDFVTAFSNSDASVGLVLGSFVAILITMVYMMIRKVMSFKDMMACLPEGFQAMVPAILILSCAWTLKAMTDSLGAKIFVSQLVEGSAAGLQMLLPAIIFIIAIGLSFATGTSWGTFGILIPIVLSVFQPGQAITIVAVSACMAGAVCGDHCSPISDTTIMASAGAQCDHVNHVSTQLPYALTVAAVSAVSYMIAGAVCNWVIVLPIAIVLQIAVLVVIKKITKQ